MLKRLFDIVCAWFVLWTLFPVFLVIAILVGVTSPGGVFFRQVRVGKGGRDFKLWKFRSMTVNSEGKGQLTVGARDARVTKIGYWLRKYKLDEFPQLLNILAGDMSIVGPRPEVRKYVDMYNEDQLNVLSVRPGLTDYASIEYANENELLAAAADPEKLYIEEIMPAKLALNQRYIAEQSLATDLKIIFKTIGKIL